MKASNGADYGIATIVLAASAAACAIAIPLRSASTSSLLFWLGGIGLLVSLTWLLALWSKEQNWGGIRQFLGVIGVAIMLGGVLAPLIGIRMSVWDGRRADVTIPDVQGTATDGVYTAEVTAARVVVDPDTGGTTIEITLHSDGRYNPEINAEVRAPGAALSCRNGRGHLDTNQETLGCDGTWTAGTAQRVRSITFGNAADE